MSWTEISWKAIRALMCAAAVVALPAVAYCADLYVSPSGDDNAAGTEAAPFKTVMRGVTRLAPGDTLHIGTGDYKEPVTISFKGDAEKPTVITCQNGTWLHAAGKDGVSISKSSYLTIEGLKITGAERAGVYIAESDHVTISGCLIADSRGSNVHTTMSDYITVERCQLVGAMTGHGILFSSTDHPTAADNTIQGNVKCGVSLNGNLAEGGDGMITGAKILRNKMLDNGIGGGGVISMDGAEKAFVENNVCDHNYGGGIIAFKDEGARAGSGNQLIHSVVRFAPGIGQYGIKIADGSIKAVVNDSIVAIDNGPSMDVDAASVKGFKAAHNFYASPSKPATFTWKGEVMSYNQWAAATGQEDGSSTAIVPINDPGFEPAPGAVAPKRK